MRAIIPTLSLLHFLFVPVSIFSVMNFQQFILKLQRRNVIKAALAYLAVAWVILQIASITETINLGAVHYEQRKE